MSERIATLSHSRCCKQHVLHVSFQPLIFFLSTVTSELMFELYSVPSLTYCVDSLMSLYQNKQPAPLQLYSADGLVVSLNTASTSVIPVLNGRGIMNQAKRCASTVILFYFVSLMVEGDTQHSVVHLTVL